MLMCCFCFFVIFVFSGEGSHQVPSSPCPDIFNYYVLSGSETVVGVATFKNDFSGEYRVEVNMSVAGLTEKNIRIMRESQDQAIQRGGDLEYRIIFPSDQKRVPVLTGIVFNKKLFCTGPPEKLTENGVTSLSAWDYFKTNVSPGFFRSMKPSSYNQNMPGNLPSMMSEQKPPTTTNEKPPMAFEQRPSMFENRPGTAFENRPGTAFDNRPSQTFDNRPTQKFDNRPALTFDNRPALTFDNRPTTTIDTSNFNSTKFNLPTFDQPNPITNVPTLNLPSLNLPTLNLPNLNLPNPNVSSHIEVTITKHSIIKTRFSDIQSECGIAEDYQPLVVRGKPTRSGEYPWLVAMFYLDDEENYKFRCAGNLITKKHVLTAAHCMKGANQAQVTKESLLLVFGKHNIKTWAVRSTIRDVKNIYVHPEFEHPGDADLAVLHLFEEVKISTYIRPVCLWTENDNLDDIVHKRGTVVGWGKDEFGHEFVNEPKQLDMPVVSQEECLRSDDRFLRITSNRTFCAGDQSGAAPCSGDSGGGFLMRKEGRWHLRGLVSVALMDPKRRSCDTKNYIVFADVPKFSRWIDSILDRTT